MWDVKFRIAELGIRIWRGREHRAWGMEQRERQLAASSWQQAAFYCWRQKFLAVSCKLSAAGYHIAH